MSLTISKEFPNVDCESWDTSCLHSISIAHLESVKYLWLLSLPSFFSKIYSHYFFFSSGDPLSPFVVDKKYLRQGTEKNQSKLMWDTGWVVGFFTYAHNHSRARSSNPAFNVIFGMKSVTCYTRFIFGITRFWQPLEIVCRFSHTKNFFQKCQQLLIPFAIWI